MDLRGAVSIEMYSNRGFYLNHPYFIQKKENNPKWIVEKLVKSSISGDCMDQKDMILAEAMINLKNYTRSSLMTMLALSSVIERNIVSVYPNTHDFQSEIFNGEMQPRSGESKERALHIMWSQINNLDVNKGKFTPNHFVPLIEETLPVSPSKRPHLTELSAQKPSKIMKLDGQGDKQLGKILFLNTFFLQI